MAKQTTNDNIIKFPRPRRFNIAVLVIVAIAIYVCIFIVMSFTKKHIIGYEVKEGSLTVSNSYNGLILRDETIVTCNANGYINYYAREGEKVACGDLVYTVDGSGKLAEMLSTGNNSGENKLSDSDLKEIKDDIIHFSKDFKKENFNQVYNFKYNLQSTSLKLANLNILNSIDTLSGLNGISVKMITAPKSGYIVYNTDGFEDMHATDINKKSFDTKNYEKIQLVSNEILEPGDPVYKTINSENWKIIIPVDEKRALELEEDEYVQVKFLKTQTKSWASTEIFQNEGEYYCALNLNNSVSSFCSERFLDIELISEEETGLKIPNSAIAKKDFFLIPKEYCREANVSADKYYFVKEAYMEDGTLSTKKMELTVYGESDTEYYVNGMGLDIGDYFLDENENKFALSKKGSLIGVYNMNKGYADFRQITILYQNDEYAIVKSNTNYGLNAYDYIVLDAESVDEDDFIYE